MRLPFTVEQFFDVFRQYNEALWPAQLVLVAIAVVAVAMIIGRYHAADVAVSGILAFLWAWIGLAYHLAFFAAINPLAYVFAAVSVAGAIVFLWQGVFRRRLRFHYDGGPRSIAGVALILFALVAYPIWAWYAGHRYPAVPTFGLPCPTTIFTIGILAFLVSPYPRSPFVVPVLWSLVGAQAAVLLRVPQDLGLVAAALIGIAMMVQWSTRTTPIGSAK
jgi:hypothetical protein